MLFGNSKTDFNINIEGVIIPLVTHTKFLGVYLDKIQTNKHLLSLGCNLLDSHTLKNIYYTHIHPHISYALTVLGSMAPKAQLSELKKLKN